MAAPVLHTARGRIRFRRAYRPMSEINVTPLVDVMLVLLVVFMIAAPLMTVGVPVDLPKAAARSLPTDKDPLFVSVRKDGRVFVREAEVSMQTLVPTLVEATGRNPDARILVRGDKSNSYGQMMQVMGAISAAGFRKFGLVTETPTPAGDGRSAPAAPRTR